MSDEHADQADDPIAGDPPNPLERALDLLLYGPVGVALTVAEDLPGLVDKGRQRVEQEISNARVVGQFFISQLPNQIEQQVQQRFGGLLNLFGSNSEAAEEPDAAATTNHAGDTLSPVPPASSPQAPPKPAADPADTAVVEQALAGYDTLSASQVVRRLESLGADQLRAVHRHEASHRNRRTILNRTSQLLDEAGPAASLAE
ncbi:MAG TPA: hypothetical protein VGG38_17665 [Acidimicrobiales bacterium]